MNDLTPREALESLTARGIDRDAAGLLLRQTWQHGPLCVLVPGGYACISWSAWRFAVSTTQPRPAA